MRRKCLYRQVLGGVAIFERGQHMDDDEVPVTGNVYCQCALCFWTLSASNLEILKP